MTRVSVDFSFDTKYGKYSDAIWYDDALPMTEEEIENEKQARVARWIAAIENPPLPSDAIPDVPPEEQ